MTPYKRKIGDLLLNSNKITPAQLNTAIVEQQNTGARLGQTLCQLNFISAQELLQVLSNQYNLSLLPSSSLAAAKAQCKDKLSKKMLRWLSDQGVSAVSVNMEKNELTVAIDDPTNELLIEKIINYVSPYTADFVLIDPTS